MNDQYSSVKDSGVRERYSTGAVRDTGAGKGRFDLLPAYPLKRLAVHYENGARKYSDRNWEKGIPLKRFMDSALRHLFCYQDGQRDEDHLAAAAWNVLGFIWTEREIAEGRLPEDLGEGYCGTGEGQGRVQGEEGIGQGVFQQEAAEQEEGGSSVESDRGEQEEEEIWVILL